MVDLVDAVHPDHRAVGTNARAPLRLVESSAVRAKAILVVIVGPAAVVTPHFPHSRHLLCFLHLTTGQPEKQIPSSSFSQN